MPIVHCIPTGEVWESDKLKPLKNVISIRIVQGQEAKNVNDFIITGSPEEKEKLLRHIERCARFSRQFFSNGLRYAFCDDWYIYAKDRWGKLYYVSTEFWHQWLEYTEEQQQEKDAVEKYMLPVALQRWNLLNWTPCDDESYEPSWFERWNIVGKNGLLIF